MANIEQFSIKADSLGPRPITEQLEEAFNTAGLQCPHPIQMDGRIHRFSTGHKQDDDAGWYCLFGDNIPAGAIGNWRTGETHNFRADMPRKLSFIEESAVRANIEKARAQREEAAKVRHERAAATVAEIWDAAAPASPEHPYLARKGVQPHGARIGGDGRLLLPLYDSSGALSSLQYIDADGRKMYHPGGAVGGCYNVLGSINEQETVYIAEGFATAATICETVHATAVSAYSANNLPAVTGLLRSRYPTLDIVIVADNDVSKTGENYANQASAKHGARVIVIPNEGQDANDFAAAGGDLAGLLNPPKQKKFFSLDSELLQDQKPVTWLIKKWLPEHATCIIHGASGLGKTFTVLDMALSVAYKNEWNGKKVKNCFVAYLAGEGHVGIRWRVRAWRQHNGITDHGKMYFSSGARTLDTPEGLLFVLSELRSLEIPPKMIIIDTVHKHFAGEENSNTDVGTFIRALDTIRDEFDATVVAIHHSGHGENTQKRSRGAGAFRDDVDVSIAIYEENGQTLMEQMKQKEEQKEPPAGIVLERVVIDGIYDEDGDEVSSAVSKIVQVETKEQVKKDKEAGAKKADKDILLRMWRFSGAEVNDENNPFISLSAMKRYASTVEGKTEKQAKEWMNPSKTSSLVSRLLKNNTIEWSEKGASVIDEDVKSVFFMTK